MIRQGLSFGITTMAFSLTSQARAKNEKNLYYVIAVHRILETIVTFHFSGGKVYSRNKGCHT